MTAQRNLVDERGDASLVAAVAESVSSPRSADSNSFILHAPLELAARYGLLPFVRTDRRFEARDRIADVARQWEAHSPAVRAPRVTNATAADPAGAMVAALAAGDVDAADAAAVALSESVTPEALVSEVGDAILPCTTAAAHAAIFLYLLPRVAPRGELPVSLLRPLARELARFPDWRLRWIDDFQASPVAGTQLFDALAATPFVGMGASPFIHPMLMQVDPTGIAREALAHGVPVDDLAGAQRSVLRAAALSMLLEPDEHAPYGWSHCLTMSQAALGIAARLRDPARAIAIAATYVVGFRATLASAPLQRDYAPVDPGCAWGESFEAGSQTAAAAVWHAPVWERASIVEVLATRAAVHADAHLVKYTLACLDAASLDPMASPLYLAACAHLHGVWATRAQPWSD